MFRLWGKEFKDNHMLRDTVICDETDETERIRSSMLWTRSVMSSISANRSGWIIILMNSKDMTRQDSIRITLWIPLILTIWRFILLKNKNHSPRVFCSGLYNYNSISVIYTV